MIWGIGSLVKQITRGTTKGLTAMTCEDMLPILAIGTVARFKPSPKGYSILQHNGVPLWRWFEASHSSYSQNREHVLACHCSQPLGRSPCDLFHQTPDAPNHPFAPFL